MVKRLAISFVSLPFLVRQRSAVLIFLFTGMIGLSGCGEEPADTQEPDSVIRSQILDQESLFSESAQQELLNLMDSLEEVSGIDLMVVTVGQDAADGLLNYAAFQKNRLSVGEDGLNNGAIIFLSDFNREVKVEMGYGLEWVLSDTASGNITGLMTPELAVGNYQEAVTIGLTAIASANQPEDWQLSDQIWNWTDSLQIGQLVRFTGKATGRAYQEGVAPEVQFHPNYFVEVYENSSTEDPIFLLFSRYMADMIDLIVYGEESQIITGRVMGKEPYVIALTGVERGTTPN